MRGAHAVGHVPVSGVGEEELALGRQRGPDVLLAIDVLLAPVDHSDVTCGGQTLAPAPELSLGSSWRGEGWQWKDMGKRMRSWLGMVRRSCLRDVEGGSKDEERELYRG